MKVIPTVFVTKKEDITSRFDTLVTITNHIQIDFMDGEFVETESPKITDIPQLSKEIFFEAHLMYQRPKKFVEDCIQKGFKRIIFHYESQENEHEVHYMWIYIKKNNIEPMLAINPETSIDVLQNMSFVNSVLLMGVHPGKENQTFIPETINKVREIKERFPKIYVQIDGGINPESAKQLKKAGADAVNTGSFVSNSENPKKALQELEQV